YTFRSRARRTFATSVYLVWQCERASLSSFLLLTFYFPLSFFFGSLLFALCPDGRRLHPLAEALRDHFHDLLPVKPAVLDENIRRVSAADGAARQEDAGHVGFER